MNFSDIRRDSSRIFIGIFPENSSNLSKEFFDISFLPGIHWNSSQEFIWNHLRNSLHFLSGLIGTLLKNSSRFPMFISSDFFSRICWNPSQEFLGICNRSLTFLRDLFKLGGLSATFKEKSLVIFGFARLIRRLFLSGEVEWLTEKGRIAMKRKPNLRTSSKRYQKLKKIVEQSSERNGT